MATKEEIAAKAEADRRAKLTQEQREAEDAALLQAMEDEERAKNAEGPGSDGSTPGSRAALAAKVAASNKAKRDKAATVEATIARGRTVFLEAGQTVPFSGGDKVMLTPEEHAKLSAAGHLLVDGSVPEPVGPKVYSEAGLLMGHAPNQGQVAESAKK